MTYRGRILIAGIALAAVAAAWRLWPMVRPPAPAASTAAPQPSDAEVAAQAAAWLKARIGSATPVASAAGFESPSAIEAASPDLQRLGLAESDARAAMTHAAEMLYWRYVQKDLDAYTRWRHEMGYEFCPIEQLRADLVLLDTVQKVAGRNLREDERDARDLWRLYWQNGIEATPRVTRADQTAGGVVLVPTAADDGLALRAGGPGRRGVPSPIMQTPPMTPGSRVGLWRGLRAAQGWPMWFPPQDVRARLERPGVRFIEIGWVLGTSDGKFQPLVLSLGMDPPTRRWWIMQWFMPHVERGVHLEAGGI